MLVHERHERRLLARDDVVRFECVTRTRRAELALEIERVARRANRGLVDAHHAIVELFVEREPHAHAQEITERARRLVERAALERVLEARGESGLRRFEAREGVVESLLSVVVVVRERVAHEVDGARVDHRVRRHRTDGNPARPHDEKRSLNVSRRRSSCAGSWGKTASNGGASRTIAKLPRMRRSRRASRDRAR